VTFVAPTTVEDALAEMVHEGAVAVAGGTSVAMLLKNDLLDVAVLVSLRHVTGLRGIGLTTSGEVRLGATVTMREVARSRLILEHLPALAQAAGHVGNPRVRAVATLGGALVHGDPRQDLPPALLALGARVRVGGPAGVRELPLSDFFLGFMTTALDENELLLDVLVPVERGQLASYLRFTPGSVEDYPIVAAAAAISLAADGTVSSARIGLGGAASTAVLADAAAQALIGHVPDREAIAVAASLAASGASPSSDQRGSADYKRAMLEVWTARALERCLGLA
jgi:carbon-monoxide dehydrogenase medium subunit